MPQGEGRKFREVPDVCSAGLNQVTDKRKPALAQGQGWKKSWKIFGFCLTGAAWRDGGAWRKGELRSQDQQLEQDSDTSQVAQIQHWGLPRGSQNPVPCSDPITCWVNSVPQLLQYPISFTLAPCWGIWLCPGHMDIPHLLWGHQGHLCFGHNWKPLLLLGVALRLYFIPPLPQPW